MDNVHEQVYMNKCLLTLVQTMRVGQTIVLDAATNPLTAPEKIKFKSSAKKIVSVTKNGVIKAKKKGKATITIKAGKAKLKVKITVK